MKYLSIVVMSLLLLTACSENKNKQQETTDDIEINWARPGKKGGISGAFLEYKNQLEIADTLISVDSEVAEMTQIHETYTTDDGLSGMRQVESIIVGPGERLLLKKGGYHIMLMHLTQDLEENQSVEMVLHFKQAGQQRIELPVLSTN